MLNKLCQHLNLTNNPIAELREWHTFHNDPTAYEGEPSAPRAVLSDSAGPAFYHGVDYLDSTYDESLDVNYWLQLYPHGVEIGQALNVDHYDIWN
jgi:hypothetical protein